MIARVAIPALLFATAGLASETRPFYADLREAYEPLKRAQQALILFKRKSESTGQLRSRFTDIELDRLAALSSSIEEKASRFEADLGPILKRHSRELLEVRDPQSKLRLEMIRAVERTRRDKTRSQGLETLAREFGSGEAIEFPLFPYGLGALIPPPGLEEMALVRASNPFPAARTAWMNFNGDTKGLRRRFSLYRHYRDLDNPPLHSTFGKDSPPSEVPVAFLDTGLDFVQYPKLATYLGDSYDYADNDRNPWLPAIGDGVFTHGTGTALTFIELIEKGAPALLQQKKIELRMWKTRTVRQLLSRYASKDGLKYDDSSWESRPAIHDSLISEITLPDYEKVNSPKVLVAPFAISLRERLLRENYSEEFLQGAPWVWVMAAGNDGTNPRMASPAPCLLDLPDDYRPESELICVGAAVRTEAGPRPADYSNPGPDVDLYALESYSPLCPGSTSCATPAIGAAAAMLLGKYPSLSKSDVRDILLEASTVSEWRGRRFRFFDPGTMMPKAFSIAEEGLGIAP